ncbi:hypothetical protein BKA56DRAFT_40867 [Ilyonectria sp. MPI-CAGE-AT-0026]|nr:hypothetical protein BKA56DRAFT_40867 [Ilyonectria sp. MPI-CAGE-AT-0026]
MYVLYILGTQPNSVVLRPGNVTPLRVHIPAIQSSSWCSRAISFSTQQDDPCLILSSLCMLLTHPPPSARQFQTPSASPTYPIHPLTTTREPAGYRTQP